MSRSGTTPEKPHPSGQLPPARLANRSVSASSGPSCRAQAVPQLLIAKRIEAPATQPQETDPTTSAAFVTSPAKPIAGATTYETGWAASPRESDGGLRRPAGRR
jgi:hypothetical protein